MGFKIKLNNISVPTGNQFKVFYKLNVRTPGNASQMNCNHDADTIGNSCWGTLYTGGTSNGIYTGGTTTNIEIDFDLIDPNPFGKQYWFKIWDKKTKSHIIENIYIHEYEYYRYCDHCCDFSGGTASFVLYDVTPTPTATNTPTPTATNTPTPTATVTNTPTPTPTVVLCDLTISSTITTAPTNQAGTNGTSVITFTTTNGPSTYTLNGVSKGACTSPLTISNLSSSVEYTVVITDSNSCTKQSVFTLGQTTFTFSADYIMVTYEFTDGRDLDTRTRIVSPFVGQDTQNEYLGWNCQYRWPLTGTEYLTWSGDNTGTGFESILVNLTQFNIQNPSATQILMDMRGFWFGTVGIQPVNVAATLWKGGTPVKVGFIWTNSTATATYNINSVGKQVTSQGAPVKGTSSGERIATLAYNLVTGVGSLDNNDTTTATV
jgi:hypothetical protein